MKLQKISLAFLLMMVPVAMVTGAWVWESAENLCAGIQIPCTDGPSCTRVALGPCKGSETKQPESFLTTEMIASGALDLDKYLSCNSNTDGTCEHAELTVFTGPGFRDGRGGLTTDDGGEYGYTMTGNVYGNTAVEGGYLGTASYLNTGSTTIKSNSNLFFGAATGQARVDRSSGTVSPISNSAVGAPNGPYRICISDVSNGACNGPQREFPPSAYKFSLFGNYVGPGDFSQYTNAGMNHFGFRAKIMARGFDVSNLKVNGRPYSEEKVNDDVNSIELDHPEYGGLHYEFPKKYNLGNGANAVPDGETMAAVIETKDMNIRVSGKGKENGVDYFYIDYIFQIEGIQNLRYFVYDPDVTFAEAGESSSTGTTFSAIIATALLIVTMLLA